MIGINGYAASDNEILQVKKRSKSNENKKAVCLITGVKEKPVNTTYSSFIWEERAMLNLLLSRLILAMILMERKWG